MAKRIFDTKKRASSFCKSKNKRARKFRYSFRKRKLGGFLISKYPKTKTKTKSKRKIIYLQDWRKK